MRGEPAGEKPGERVAVPVALALVGEVGVECIGERGNGFGCSPEGGHNLDIALPGLESLAPGTPVKLTFKSRWDM